LGQGNPTVITAFPGPDEIKNHYAFEPNVERLFAEKVERDFIVLTQMPG
jgi:type I restriction enzyme R subunit